MLATVDLRKIEPHSTDPGLLNVFLLQLVGKPFLQLEVSYGDELMVHFGEPKAYRQKRLAHLVEGAYVLGVRASRWWLAGVEPPMVVLSEPPTNEVRLTLSHKEALEKHPPISPGAWVTSAVAIPWAPDLAGWGFRLTVSFSDGAILSIIPNHQRSPHDQPADLADWELFTPHHRCLTVGPGLQWTHLASNERETTGNDSTRATA